MCMFNQQSVLQLSGMREQGREREDTAKQIDLTRCRFTEQTVESRPGNSEAGRRNEHTHNFTSEVHQQI